MTAGRGNGSSLQALLGGLTPAELKALQNIGTRGSVRDLAGSLSTDIANAAEIMNSMKLKIGAVRDADAVRVAIYADIQLDFIPEPQPSHHVSTDERGHG